MSDLTATQAEIRAEFEQLILDDLLGPAGGAHEVLVEARVQERYVLGLLAPVQTWTPAEEADRLAVSQSDSTDEGQTDVDAPPSASLMPSACGLTFAVRKDAGELLVDARWGRYLRAEAEIDGQMTRVWERIPMGGTLTLRLVHGALPPHSPDPDASDVFIEGRVRDAGDQWLVTLFLVNRQPEPQQLKDEAWLFQASFSVADPDGQPVFQPTAAALAEPSTADQLEAAELAMVYRDRVQFAVGHAVGVDVTVDDADPRRAVRIATAAVPVHEVPPTDAGEHRVPNVELDMRVLASAQPAQLTGLLVPLADAYQAWIDQQHPRLESEPDLTQHLASSRRALGRCQGIVDRIRAGIDLLSVDSHAAQAFAFANAAMADQRVHSLAAQSRARSSAEARPRLPDALSASDDPANHRWRPFQLAFLLLNLPALADPSHPERAQGTGLVDLLWFPTGGGKTEAYLGCIAFVLAVRRLQGDSLGPDASEGVAVIMRYTLRLLTIQQFQRATALVCACEVIRRQDPTTWGHTPFRIGLWVGMAATPNTTEDARQWLQQHSGAARGRPTGRSGTPAQLGMCPWCGEGLRPGVNIKSEPDLGRTLTRCTNRDCDFTARASHDGEGLPVVVVDEEIYHLLPAVLIGTVDKFAQLPWRGSVQTLFGRVDGRCERHGYRSPGDDHADSHTRRGHLPAARTLPAGPLRPPDLIVQDELHLIAGPLGSMVGLYETAIDELCAWQLPDGKTTHPKVVASTATVRRAEQQAHALFWRRLAVFPPPGLDARDSFFAAQPLHADAEHPGRRYLGVCAHGRRFKAALIRIYVASLAAAQTVYLRHGQAADPYLTLVGYFSSLRELGGMRRLVDDDVNSRLKRMDRRGLETRLLHSVEELTSRVGSTEIPQLLDRLSVPFPPDPQSLRDANPRPIDVVLATNMVSVGVDVPRLGIMVVAGQPKATAEYIQATSRVGRIAPGLVITAYNWARPRDLSHYETHAHYHSTFYAHVEALSATPFARRALDRGLTGVLVGLTRQRRLKDNPDPAAATVDVTDLDDVIDQIRRRAEAVTASTDIGQEVEAKLADRLDGWGSLQAVGGRKLAYRPRADGVTAGLIRAPGLADFDEWTCLTSLRDVEPTISLLLVEGSLEPQEIPVFEMQSVAPSGEDET